MSNTSFKRISAGERRRRQEAVWYAQASVGLEGFQLTDQVAALAQRFIDGEIELSEFMAALPRDVGRDR
ncbi:antitoxin VbhA family protein [Xanthomonas euvesicatoria]|uniref:antitoxin VbhA family protein n=1 Tax=Xanthomonas euvesicatoria TaxID=456327 RepID=UPI002405B976|nr:antitoxin VbhA family protein [Xanthomonas euvesicatoria]MCP3041562.1 antitoxin VbhA family protein [Xanthomonas euvesicatoria pv. allii]